MNSLFRSFGFDAPSKVGHGVGERSQAARAAPPAEVVLAAAPGPTASTVNEERAMARRRSEALRAFFPKLFSWFASRWDVSAVSGVNAYLEQSTDLADLERRIHRLERRRHFHA